MESGFVLRRLSLWYFVSFIYSGLFFPFFGLYLKAVGFEPPEIGVLMALSQGARVLGPNAWAALADRLGRRTLVVQLTALGAFLCFSAIFLGGGFWFYACVLGLVGLFATAGLPLVETLTLLHLGSQVQRYGRVRLWGSLGFVLTVVVAGHGLAWWGIASLPSLIWLSLLGSLVCAFYLHDPAAATSAGAELRLQEEGAQVSLPERLAFFAGCFAIAYALGVLYTFYSVHLANAGYGKDAVAWLWTVGVVAEIAVFQLMPSLMRRFSVRTILAMAGLGCLLRFVLIGWCVNSPIVIVLAQLMHGLCFAAFHAAAMARLKAWFPGHQLAKAQAIYGSVCVGSGGLLSGLLGAWVWASVGPAWTFSLSALLGGVAALLFLYRGVPLGRLKGIQ